MVALIFERESFVLWMLPCHVPSQPHLFLKLFRFRLTKVIAQRWKRLPSEGRAFYRSVAKADQEEYDRFMPPEVRQKQVDNRPPTVAASI
jgi:hypothetical protein